MRLLMTMDFLYGTGMNLAFQQFPDWQTLPMQLVSLCGTTEIYILMITGIYWCYDTRLGIRLAIIIASTGWLNDILKLSMHLPRPTWIDSHVKMLNLKPEFSFGFPSGHSQMTLPFYGMIGYWLKSWIAWVVLIALILATGISRIYLGVHFPLDVLGGWFLGLTMIGAIIILDKPISSRINNLSNLELIGGGLILSIFLVLMTALVSAGNAGFIIPSGWTGINPVQIPNSVLFSLSNSFLTSGFLFGIITGYAYTRKLSFSTTGGLVIKCVRYLTGITGIALIIVFFRCILHFFTSQTDYLLIWVLGLCLGFWILYGAPWIFVRFGMVSIRYEPNFD
jgi:membrane-associated phospholipid phosphatase